MSLGDPVYQLAGDARFLQGVPGAGGGVQLDAQLLKAPGDGDNLPLVLVLDRDDNPSAPLRRPETGALEGLQQRLGEGLRQAQHLAGGLHLRTQADVHIGELFKGEHRRLHREIVRLLIDARTVLQILQLLSQHHPGGQVDDGHAGDLGDIGDGPGGPGVDLNDINIVVIENILGVDEADDPQMLGHIPGMLQNQRPVLVLQVEGRVHGHGVPGVDSGPLHVLHDAGNQNVLSVEYAVHLQLPAHEILVHQNGMLLHRHVDDFHELLNVPVGIGNLHTLAAQHVGGPHQHGISQLMGGGKGLLGGEDGPALGPGDAALLQNLVEALPVLGGVHTVGGGAQDAHAHIGQGLGQLDGGLSAELDHRSPGLFQLHDGLHVLGGEGLEVELIRYVEVGGDGLGVVVDNDGLAAQLFQGPDRVDGAVVKFDALADADGTGAQHQHLLFAGARVHRLVLPVVAGVVVGGFRVELGGAGVHHLEGGVQAVFLPQSLYLALLHMAQGSDVAVGKAHLLGPLEGVRVGDAPAGF